MTGPVIANVFIGEGGTSSNDGTRTKVSRSKVTMIMMRLRIKGRTQKVHCRNHLV